MPNAFQGAGASEVTSIFGKQVPTPCYGLEQGRKPHAHGSNSAFVTVCIIIGDVVGAGMLSLPIVVSHVGWLNGTLLLVMCALFNVHSGLMVWRVYMACPGATTYSGLVGLAFAGAPPAQRDFAVSVAKTGQFMNMIAVLGIYLLTATKGLGSIFYDVNVCFPSWALGTCCLLLPMLASTRTLGTWKWPIFVNAAAMLVVVGIPLFVFSREGPNLEVEQRAVAIKTEVSFSDALVTFCSMFFAFSGQFLYVEIMSEMRDPEEFPRCLCLYGLLYELCLFTAAGIGGYVLLGDHMHGIMLDYLPFGPALQSASVCLVLNMLIAFCIKAVVTGRMVHSALQGEEALSDTGAAAIATWKLVSLGLVAAAYLLSQIVPFFVDAVNFVGAAIVPLLCYIVPIVMYVRWLYDSGGKDDMPGPLEKALMAIELLICVCLTIFGTYFVSTRIIEQWHMYGMPFDCHCEYLWRSCVCSAGRPGMDSICGASQALDSVIARELSTPLFVTR